MPSLRPVRTPKLFVPFILKDFARYRLNMAYWINLSRFYFQSYISNRSKFLLHFFITYLSQINWAKKKLKRLVFKARFRVGYLDL